jgi:hypothetical protein
MHGVMAERLPLVCALLFGLLAVACGGGDKSGSDANVDPRAVLQESAAKLKDVRFFHFKLSHENGTTPMPLNLQLVSAEGDVATPDRLQADVRARAAGQTISVKVVGIGERSWITNPFTRQWDRMPGNVSIREVADPQGLVSSLIGQMRDVRYAGDDTVDGVRAYRIEGKADSGALADVIASAQSGQAIDVQMWIGIDDRLPYKVKILGPLSRDESKDIARTLDLSKYGAAVDIKEP